MNTKPVKNKKAVDILRRLAKKSKMDCWFSIDDDGYCHNLEDNGKVIGTKKAIGMLVDGLTEYDISCLTESEKVFFFCFLAGCAE